MNGGIKSCGAVMSNQLLQISLRTDSLECSTVAFTMTFKAHLQILQLVFSDKNNLIQFTANVFSVHLCEYRQKSTLAL